MAGLKNILLVEDDAMIREMYRLALVTGHFKVELAGDANEAFSKLATFHPDCILLDVMLPGMSGLEILKELRTDPKHGCQHTKIVVLTNLAERSVTDKAIEGGADAYIVKTDIVPRDLRTIIPSLEDEGQNNKPK